MQENIKLRNIVMLNIIDCGIFTILKVFPENIRDILPLSDGGTEIVINNQDGTTTKVKVAHSEKEIRELQNKCIELDNLGSKSEKGGCSCG